MMTKNKKIQFYKRITYGLFAIVALLTVTLVVELVQPDKANNNHASHKTINVELGGYEYDIKDGKAIKLSDNNVASLKVFLDESAKKDISDNCKESYYQVVAYSESKNQVLLSYGCESPGAKMFAIQESGKWRFLSPTNQFDMLGTPLCSHVDENNIDKSIAPVCYSETNDSKKPLSYRER